MDRLFRLRRMLNRFELQKLMSEYDQMSMTFAKNSIQPSEVIEYARGSVKESTYSSWFGICYISNQESIRQVKKFIRKSDIGKVVIGVTTFPLFMECRSELSEIGNVDVILFKSLTKDQPFLEYCNMIQEFEEIDDYEYVIMIDEALTKMGNVDFESLEKMLERSHDKFIVPHQMSELPDEYSYTSKNKRHYRVNEKYYYVSSFDPSFDMDNSKTLYYSVKTPVKFVRIKNCFVCRTSAFKELEICDYYFNKWESIFLSLLNTNHCVFLTSPKTFFIEEEPLIKRIPIR